MANQTCVAPDAHRLPAHCTVHAPSESEEVMVAAMLSRTTIWFDQSALSVLRRGLSVSASACCALTSQWHFRTPKDGKMSPSSATAASPSRHCNMAASTDVRGSMRCETLCRGRTSKRALAASLLATSTPCPFTHYRKDGRLKCKAMHMLRTCVSSISCILLVNLPRNEMARSTAALAGQYVRNNAETRQTFTH